MKLTYRNAQYQRQSMGQACVLSKSIGVYRGAEAQFKTLPNEPIVSGFSVLTYRGAQYRRFVYQQSADTVKPVPSKVIKKKQFLEPGRVSQYPAS